jgi:peptidoglycan/LPS O-acetylase OafA/YrhL
MTQNQRKLFSDSSMHTAGSASKRSVRLSTIQGGRGVAALAVALFHANVAILPLELYHGTQGPRLFDIGNAGVEFFFVLSGFIIFIVHRNDFGRPERAWRFLRKRFARIYPIYWLIMALVLAVHPLVPEVGGNPPDLGWLLGSLALLPTNGFPMLAVAWTLEHEILFYAAFISLLISPRIGRLLFGAWGIACIAGMLPFLHAYVHPFPWHFLLSPFNLLFGLGMLSAIAAERINPVWIGFLLWAGLAVFLAAPLTAAYNIVHWNDGLMTVCEGIGAAMAVAGLAAGERRRGWFAPLALALLGDASYSIYLIHLPAMKLATPLIASIGLPAFTPPLLMLVLCGAIALGTGMAMHFFAERPLIKFAGRAFSDTSNRPLSLVNSNVTSSARGCEALGRVPAHTQKPRTEAQRALRLRGRQR